MFDLLKIKDPSFLDDLSIKEMEQLSAQIREFLIESLSKTGGHLSSNLGVVELSIALHKVFDSPKDKLIFDVGHQAYVHKILTGRAKDFDKLRMYKGLSGFIKRNESIHDVYEAGHSSTSIAAAAGIEFAKKYSKDKYKVVPIIGDGALTGGMAFEALNFLGGHGNHQPIIILNDNEMSISENIGYLSKLLNGIRGKNSYKKMKLRTKKILPKFLRRFSSKVERGIKGFITNNTIFDDLGFSYYGPINGHSLKELIKTLEIAKKSNRPCVVHVLTKKGKGYEHSENDVLGKWHGVSPFNIETGITLSKSEPNSYSWSEVINKYMIDYANKNEKFTIVVPAMIGGSKLQEFKNTHPNKIIDVGIAEQTAVTMSSGFALSGIDVFTPIYSTFIQRAYDQVNHDVARQNLKVVFGIDRAGIVGADGETHQGVFDIPLLRHIPNMVIGHPRNAENAFKMLHYAFKVNKKPFAIRYERGIVKYDFNQGISTDSYTKPSWEIINKGTGAIFVGFGSILDKLHAKTIEDQMNLTIVDAMFIKPLDTSMIDQLIALDKPIILYEESSLLGGFGSSVLEYLVSTKQDTKNITLMGIKDSYVEQGTKEELLKELNLDVASIIKTVNNI